MSLIYFLFDLFCDNNIYSQPQPPPPPPAPPLHSLQTEIVVQFYPWSKCNFLLFSTHTIQLISYIIIHYHTQKPTYLGNMGNCLSRKAEMPTSVVDSGDSLFFTSPSPVC